MNDLAMRCNNNKNSGCNAILFEFNGAPVMAVFVEGQLVAAVLIK